MRSFAEKKIDVFTRSIRQQTPCPSNIGQGHFLQNIKSCPQIMQTAEPLKKVCKKSANCDKIELISQEADFLWQEEKENR